MPCKCSSTNFITHGFFSSQIAEETKRNPENYETLKTFENINCIRLQEKQRCYSVTVSTHFRLPVCGRCAQHGWFLLQFAFLSLETVCCIEGEIAAI